MIVQRKVEMIEELRRLQYEVYEKEDRVYGDGKLKWTENMERITEFSGGCYY